MKILLDESLPVRLRNDFGVEHEVLTVRDKGWLGIKNGELLLLMVEDKVEIFVTVDRNLPYQQNIEHLPIKIFILCASDNRRETLKALIPKLLLIISQSGSQKVMEIF